MKKVIEIKELYKDYLLGDVEVKVLRGIDLTVEKGDFLSVMGPSGSGKSTLMNIIGCLDIPTSGQYLLDGTDISRLSSDSLAEIRNSRIGFIFQNFNLIPRTSALENVELPMIYSSNNQKEIRDRALESLDKVGLSDRVDHTPAQLSGGQQQRVAIARAIINDPSMILADEPTGNLDSTTSEEVLKILTDLNSSGKTIVMITHEDEVAAITKRTIRIRDGQVI
ncbi:MAG: ABC transporter ATP-binding protein [Candidatus Dadabacteria bacterium]|nr:ABC transporter ATP-binding protein [Candidatus Dadabacteria bacterium]NIS07241.1 ABC transporter ATP-binding protein [Candidatus Dadabacteria bacterium]NIV40948.1 ATP-binding cassette domain-containing protein [Candidatus Dadabacteria bacterium]NIX14380.1 ATP-binding cassette domain-containing protein [Candidatus Dadabacteria bacterium]NIY20898.1 ATP-binding cassette domain-containing protein [Candidatus Dadabacteria bacterium]